MTALLALSLWVVAAVKAIDRISGGGGSDAAGPGWVTAASTLAEALAGAALLSTRWRDAALWVVGAAASGAAIGTLGALLETGGRSACRCLGAVALPSAGVLVLQGTFLAACGLCLFRRRRLEHGGAGAG